MKELKFRVWEEREKEYDTWPYILDENGNLFRNAYGALIECDKKDYIIEQYTGLKDKNGEMVYEGDIVLDCYGGDEAFIVEWDKDTASFILTDTEHILNVGFDNFYPDKYLEVIGNIHHNPEQLNIE